MNTYRLLRNNKETGPYTSDQLITSGFKPYDLIWVEGKSAGWRYPGELPEFNVVAPVVEQQPFERFTQKSSYNYKPETAVLVQSTHVEEFNSVEQKIFTVPKTSIYVTLPGNAKGSTHRVILATKEFHKSKSKAQVSQFQNEKTSEIQSASSNTTSGFFQQEEIVDSSLVLSDTFNSQDQLAEESLVVEMKQPRTLSLFSKLSIAVAVLIFGFSLVLFTNSLIQNREKVELAQMVQALKNKDKISTSNSSINASSSLPLLIDNQFIISNEALAIASESAASIISPVIDEKEVSDALTTPSINLSQNATTKIDKDFVSQNDQPKELEIEALRPSSWLINQITIENSEVIDFSKPGANANITLTNNSPVTINQAEVTIVSLDQSNQIIKKLVVKVENVAPGAKKDIIFSKNGGETSLQYSISSISYKSNGIASSK